jgi:hypothetical protein
VVSAAHRDLWTEAIRVPVLRPDTFAGGLRVLQRGSGLQTASLRFRGGDGLEYVFRSVDKEQAGGLPMELRNTLVSRLVQDQVSSKHPAAALVVARILEAAGVPRPGPRLVVLGDHPSLGAYREEFAGMLGFIEERPEEREGGAGFGGFSRVIGSEALLERLEASSRDRVDAGAYLRARLVDLLVGDWDRHPDQWRWGLEERGETRVWIAIPRDRDNAFSHFDGLIGTLGRAVRPNALRYESGYSAVYGLVHNAQLLDRRILPELPLAAWDSIAAGLRERITDEVIAHAGRAMPPEYQALGGAGLEAKLRARRDALPAIARDFYHLLATEVDVRATDEADRAEIVRHEDDSVQVRLFASTADRPYFDRRFVPTETREVRIHLHGGADHASVSGDGGGITLRVLGGGGDDVLEDVARTGGGAVTIFYDHRGDNQILTAAGTRVDLRGYEGPDGGSALESNSPPPRDWGRSRASFSPGAQWRSNIGPVLSGGPTWTRYGFRRHPYAARMRAAVMFAPLHRRLGVEGELRRVHAGGGGETALLGRASGIHATRFHGFGNESPRAVDPGLRVIWTTEYTLAGELSRKLGADARLFGAPTLSYRDPSPGNDELRELPGGRPYWIAGLVGGATVDRRQGGAVPGRGFWLEARAEGYPLARGDRIGSFMVGEAAGRGYLPLPGQLEPTLALRVVAAATTAAAPLQHAAFLGGSASLRGHVPQRFAGDAALSGTAELRTSIGRANLGLARGEIGSIAFVDAGRVFLVGERSGRIHTAYGGGAWFATLQHSLAAHLVVAFGERPTLHAGLGLPF